MECDETYDLYGVIVHAGSSRSFGHYYSYCRGFDSKWYKCNDESISQINGVEGAMGKQAYLLFYQKRGVVATPSSPDGSTASQTDESLPVVQPPVKSLKKLVKK
jgi:hypothetical protein